MRRGTGRLEILALDDYVRGLRAVDVPAPGRRRVDPKLANPVVYRGRQSRPATSNPHLRVCVFTVTEPGQLFGDPDQAKMQALLEPNVYDVNYDYYRENSFQTVETEFTVFGVHLGAPRPPLVLPQSFASYFYDDYRPGGLEAIMPGDWASPPVFDGTEAMTVHTEPAFGTGNDYEIPFAALWTTRTHAAYPVAVNFAGTETVQLDVQDQDGTMRNLNVAFGALNLNHAQGDNEAAFLDALGDHVTDAIRAAETAAGSPVVVQDVIFRRIRLNDDDTDFGRLQGQIRVAAGGAQKGRVTLTPPGAVPAALIAIGFNGVGSRSGVLASAAQFDDYFGECLHAARFDAGEGEGLNDPHLDTAVEVQENAAAQEVRVRINLASDKGGAGAEITLVSTSGLAGTGWPAAVPIAGSDSTANNQNTMRYHQDLANDVFTAAMDHIRATGPWDADAVQAQFADFDAMMIGFVGACPTTVPVAERWDCANAVDFGRLRMFVRYHQATDLNNPGPGGPVTMGTDLLIGQRFNQFDPGVMSHEVGHGLGLPDLYSAAGYRDDVVYVDRWCQMSGGNSRFNHFCAWSKWAVGWIVENPDDESLNRVIDVPMPAPEGQTTTEAWLCPVEYWDDTMHADIEAEVGEDPPIGQMMKVHLGSDGGVVDLIELRATGQAYSLQLPPTPAVIVTNVLQPGTDRRWAVNGLYRRAVHLLNEGRELRAVGDRFDFAAAPEFPVKGTVVELMELRTIRGGSIPIARVKVVREAAEFIDLYFQDNVPSWRSPDIWVDWPGDNADPALPREYPEGTPTDQGETVRFPGAGVEPHFLVVRPHNAGNVHAEDVKVRWFICDPPGAGDDGRWVQRDTMTLPLLDNGTWEIAPFTWNIDAATNDHQCIRAEIIDWTIPTEVDPATGDTLALGSDDVLLQNNNAQKNVFDFEAAT
jgi:M6 family metalloprotease-like protein